VAWVRAHTLAILAAHALLLGGAVCLIAFHLPLRADFSYLLPEDAASVRDLRKLEARVKAGDSMLVVMEAPDAATRADATARLVAGIRRAPRDLVEAALADDTELREFLRPRRHLFAPYEDLVRARDALKRRIEQAKLRGNPLFIDLDDEAAADAAGEQRQLEELRQKRREAEARLDRPGNVSPDGRITSIQIRTPFRSTDAGRGGRLIAALGAVRAEVIAAHPGVQIGFTGGVVTAVAEHAAIFGGMVASSIITGLLVALVLALYFRSATLLVLLVGTLAVATTIAFGLAAITVGHLNAATAFLGAIIAGNGVNYGILLIARYLEERRGHDVEEALARGIAGTLRPTAIASLGAAIAYGALAATSFRGFADFAIIGALGMLLCWVTTYVLLPALVLRWGRRTKIHQGEPIVGKTLVMLIGFKSSRLVVAAALAISALSAVIAARYVAADPFEYDIKQLRSEGEDAVTARRWMGISDRYFGRGITARTYIAAERRAQVPKIVAALRALDAGLPPEQQTIGSISSYLDLVPERQPEKLAVLADLRALLDDPALEALSDKERAELRELRPPDDLRPITLEGLPPALAERLTDRRGNLGLLVSVRPAAQLDEWNGRDLIRFGRAVRRLELRGDPVPGPNGTLVPGPTETITTSGSSVIFADIIDSIEHDGPIVTLVATLGLAAMVLLLVGRNRRAAAVLLSTAGGTLLMVAVCASVGLKVNFLDFVALPITLGLGIDYAINIAHRHTHEDIPDPLTTLRTSGSAVFVCSLTTIIGYGSLLVSDNLAIRGFGVASLIGEVTCVLTALVLVPAILALSLRRPPRPAPASSGAA
jgi:predicted RND superfamily exporter protein